MKKLIIPALLALVFICSAERSIAQSNAVAKTGAAVSPTPQDVLMWAKDLSQKMEQLSAKLDKIQPAKPREIETKRTIIQARQFLGEIIAKGRSLTREDAKKYDAWFRNTISKMLEECLTEHPGSECCFSAQGNHQGWAGMWFLSNCFVANFPDID